MRGLTVVVALSASVLLTGCFEELAGSSRSSRSAGRCGSAGADRRPGPRRTARARRPAKAKRDSRVPRARKACAGSLGAPWCARCQRRGGASRTGGTGGAGGTTRTSGAGKRASLRRGRRRCRRLQRRGSPGFGDLQGRLRNPAGHRSQMQRPGRRGRALLAKIATLAAGRIRNRRRRSTGRCAPSRVAEAGDRLPGCTPAKRVFMRRAVAARGAATLSLPAIASTLSPGDPHMPTFHRWCRTLALHGALLASIALGCPAFAADEPDLIFKRSTVFKWLTPNDKLATYGLDDPGGRGRGMPLHGAGARRTEGMDRRGRGGLGHLARLPPDRADPFQAEIFAGRGHVPSTALAVLQEDANRPRLRREAQCAGLHGLFRQDHRGFTEEFDLVGADHALGQRAARCRSAGIGSKARWSDSDVRIIVQYSACHSRRHRGPARNDGAEAVAGILVRSSGNRF